MHEYCLSQNIESEIFYGGRISHYQNRTLVNVLGIPLTKFETSFGGKEKSDDSIKKEASKYIKDNFDVIVYLDTSCYGGSGNIRFLSNIPDIIIDHHEMTNGKGNKKPKIILNNRCGSTSSILACMVESKKIKISKESGTALFIGLMTDTGYLTSSNLTEVDHHADAFLRNHVDFSLNARISAYEHPSALIDIRQTVYGKFFFRENNLAVVGVGYIGEEFANLVPVIADEVKRIEGIQKVVAIGIAEEENSENRVLIASIRTSADSTNTKLFAQSIFGSKFSGGKQGFAGARIPLNSMDEIGLISKIVNIDKDAFFRMIFEHYKTTIQEAHTKS